MNNYTKILIVIFLLGSFCVANAQRTGGGEKRMVTPDKGNRTDSKAKGNFFLFDIGLTMPTGAAKHFDINKDWHEAMGETKGFCFGFSHNSVVNSIGGTDQLGLGIYGQFGSQISSYDVRYSDYGYDLEDWAQRYRLEYELGPSLTYNMSADLSVMGYLKGGVGYVWAGYVTNDDSRYTVDFGSNFGFYTGIGTKLLYKGIGLGLDFNFGKKEFNGDFSEKLPVSNVRLILSFGKRK